MEPRRVASSKFSPPRLELGVSGTRFCPFRRFFARARAATYRRDLSDTPTSANFLDCETLGRSSCLRIKSSWVHSFMMKERSFAPFSNHVEFSAFNHHRDIATFPSRHLPLPVLPTAETRRSCVGHTLVPCLRVVCLLQIHGRAKDMTWP